MVEWKSPFLHVSHRVSEVQGQNPGDMVAFCLRLCLEVRWIFRPFSFFKTRPHSGHWFGLSCDSSSFLLWSLGFGFSLFAFICGGILLLHSFFINIYKLSEIILCLKIFSKCQVFY